MADRNTQIRGGQIFDGTIGESKLDITNSPVAGFYLAYDSVSSKFKWVEGVDAITEIPSGLINSSNDTYTLTATPADGSLSLYLNGLYQEEGSGKDFQLSGTSITFVTPPDTDDILIASYGKTISPETIDVDTISDEDNDTRVEVEKNADEDIIRFSTGAAGEQITLQDGSITPSVDNDVDLGSSSLKYKDAFIAGDLGDGTDSTDINNLLKGSIGFIVDGGGSVITTGIKGQIPIPFDCTIEAVTLIGDQTGSIVVDINTSTFAAFPTTGSITAAAIPTLSSSQKVTDSTLTGWTLTLTEGDIIEWEVDSITTIERCTVILDVIKR